MAKSQGPENENSNESKEKFDVTLDDLGPENSGGLNIKLEDLPPETNVRSTVGNSSQAGQVRPVQLVYCRRCGRGSQVGFRYCPHCATTLASQGGSNAGHRSRLPSRKLIIYSAIVLLALLLLTTAALHVLGVISFGARSARVVSVMVPGDYSSIQEALNSAEDGWEIIVKPGIYFENINFLGKAVILRSEHFDDPEAIKSTIIDGGRLGPVVVFNSGETADAVLSGFTIRNGGGLRDYVEAVDVDQNIISGFFGGGIFVGSESYPRIENNLIAENFADYGGGIAIINSSPALFNNEVVNNRATLSGGGLYILNAPSAKVEENYFQNNSVIGGELWVDNQDLFNAILERNITEGYESGQDES